MKGKIIHNAKAAIEAQKGTGGWLQRNIDFNHGLRLDDKDRESVKQLFDSLYEGVSLYRLYRRDQKQLDLEILIANLIHAKHWAVSISLDRKSWNTTQYGQASYFIIELVKILERTGHIKMKKGFQFEREARRTRIWTTEKLLEYIRELPPIVIFSPKELVELRDERGKLKEYRNTAETRRIRKILQLTNDVNTRADIRYGKWKLNPCLMAVFNRKFTLYGRLHTRGHRHYQGFSEDERGEIIINGQPVVESDYCGLHPYLLYAKQGIQFFGDPYSIVDDRPEVRPFLKNILLFMLNAKDETQAERAANYWLFNNHQERETLKELGITRARPLMDAFKQAHSNISHYFCTGKDTGLKVMNLDSKIALEVIKYFVKQDKPILAVHDSFIVQAQYRDELFQVMQKIYQQKTGGFRIPVK